MPYEVLFNHAAVRRLDRLKGRDYDRVQEAIDALAMSPRPHGAEKLEDDIYRIREGDWRIIYQVDDNDRAVIIAQIRRRNERTYKNY